MEKKLRFFALSLFMAIFLTSSAFDEKFYLKEYANLKIPHTHIEKLYDFKKDKVRIMTSKLPALISLSAKVVWDNLSSGENGDKAWAASEEEKSGEQVKEGQAAELKEHFKESYLALNDYLHLVVMGAELKTNPQAIVTQRETIDMYQKTELFIITLEQQKEISQNKQERAEGLKDNYRQAMENINQLNNPALEDEKEASQKKIRELQRQVRAAFKEIDGYLEMAALQIQTTVREGAAVAEAAPGTAMPAGVVAFLPEEEPAREITPVLSFPETPRVNYQIDRDAIGPRADRVLRWSDHIVAAARKYGVDPALVAAIMEQESGGNENAISRAGAIGLMQLMPGTARGLGVNPYDPIQNIDGGTKYIARQLEYFDGDITLALAAYNAGGARARKWQQIPETRHYVHIVPQLRVKYMEVFKPQ